MKRAARWGIGSLAVVAGIVGKTATADVITSVTALPVGSTPNYTPTSTNGTKVEWGPTSETLVRADGSRVDLGNLGLSPGVYNFGGPRDVNNAGTVVGVAQYDRRNSHAFVSYDGGAADPGRHIRDLSTLSGRNSAAVAVNNAGTVVGQADTVDFSAHAFAITAATYTSKNYSPNIGENNPFGAGFSVNSDGTVTSHTPLTDLGTLGGKMSAAYAINDAGKIVGASNIHDDQSQYIPQNGFTSGEAVHGFVYADGKMTDLGSLPGLKHSIAAAINATGQIVGFATDGQLGMYHAYSAATLFAESVFPGSTNTTHAFLYENGKMTDLNDLLPKDSGWLLESAMSISDSGQITGRGIYQGQEMDYRLSLSSDGIQAAPVPEPTTLALFGVVAAGAWIRRRVAVGMLTS